MDAETEREFKHVQRQLEQFEKDSRTVIVLEAGFKELSNDFSGLGKNFEKLAKKLDRLMLMIGTFGLGVIGDLILRLLKLN